MITPKTSAHAREVPRFSSEEYRRRWRAVEEIMQEHGVAGMLVYGRRGSGNDVHYLSNWLPTREAYLVWPAAADPTLLVQLYNHVDTAREVSMIDDVRFAGATDRGAVDSIRSVVERVRSLALAEERIGVVGSIPYQQYKELALALPNVSFVALDGPLRKLRSIKSEEEFERISAAAALSDAAMVALAEEAAPGMREVDVAAVVDGVHLDGGGATTVRHMLTTSMTSPDRAVPAQYPTRRSMEAGDVLVIELSAAVWGYSGQTLRTFTIGSGPTAQFAEMHEVAMAAFEGIARILRDGATTEDVHAAADLIDDAGYTIVDDLLHGANQTAPIIRTRQASHGIPAGFRFESGMAVVVQPNVATFDHRAGVQYGDMLRVGNNGSMPLHAAPEGLIECRRA